MKSKLQGKIFHIIYVIFISLFPTLFCVTCSFAGYEFISTHIQTKLQNIEEANAIIQARDGYIWIGNHAGVTRYDGKNFILYDESRGFDGGNVKCIYEARNGYIWIGSNDNGVYRYKDGSFQKITFDGILSNSVRSIIEDYNGNIFVGTSSGIGMIDISGVLSKIDDSRISNSTIISLFCANNNRIWGVTHDGRIFSINQKRELDMLLEKKHLLSRSPTCITVRGDILLIGTTDNMVLRISIDDIASGAFLWKMNAHVTGNVFDIKQLYPDLNDRIWVVGTTGAGFFSNIDNVHGAYNFEDISALEMNSSIESVVQDYEGNFWFTSSRQGVLKITKSKFVNTTQALGIDEVVVNTTATWRDKLYIGTDSGVFAADKYGEVREDEVTRLTRDIRIRCFMVDSDNNLWIATYSSHGLIKFRPDGSHIRFNHRNGLAGNRVRTLIQGKDRIIAGTSEGISIIKDGGVIRSYRSPDGLDNLEITSLYEKADGTIIAGSDGGGIYLINGSTVKKRAGEKLSSEVITRIFADEQNGVMLVSCGERIEILKIDDLSHVSSVKMSGQIFEIKKSFGKNYVFAGTNGLGIIPSKDFLNGKLDTMKIYSRSDGLISSSTPEAWSELAEDGTLHLSCKAGVETINVGNIATNDTPPKITVSYVNVDGKYTYGIGGKFYIPVSAVRVTFGASVLSFSSPGSNTISYMLKGFEDAPNITSIARFENATYTNIPGGKYSFTMSGKNSDGIESSNELVIQIEKPLSLMEQPLFMGGGVVLLMGVSSFAAWAYTKTKRDAALTKQREYREITSQAIKAIANTIDAKDKYTNGHSMRVAKYSVAIARAMGFKREELEKMHYTALLHDIGKIGVPNEILNKPGKLDSNEYEIIKKHPTAGGEILKDITTIDSIALGARFHHERFDGMGYNSGLAGKQIPLVARIISIADAYDAMASARPYRDELTKSYIISELKKNSGTQFDPEITEVMLLLIESEKI